MIMKTVQLHVTVHRASRMYPHVHSYLYRHRPIQCHVHVPYNVMIMIVRRHNDMTPWQCTVQCHIPPVVSYYRHYNHVRHWINIARLASQVLSAAHVWNFQGATNASNAVAGWRDLRNVIKSGFLTLIAISNAVSLNWDHEIRFKIQDSRFKIGFSLSRWTGIMRCKNHFKIILKGLFPCGEITQICHEMSQRELSKT